jgi:hypothetical protein
MELYSAEEVQKDISQFEGVGCVLGAELKECCFLKLYSQYFDSQMSGESTVDDLHKRIYEFLHADNVMLPPCDTFPDNKTKFWGYIPTLNEDGKISLTIPMELVACGNSLGTIVDIIKGRNSDVGCAFIVDTGSSEIHCIAKQIH